MRKSLLFLLGCLLSGIVSAATFTSQATGSWSNPLTWNIVGADGDGIPDSGDDVTISGSFTVTITAANNYCRDLTVSSGRLAAANQLRIFGDLTRTGGAVTGVSSWVFYSTAGIISGTFTNQGSWYFAASSNITIATGSIIQKNGNFLLYQNTVITNNGTVRLTNGSLTYNHSSAQWINAANSSLQVADDISGAGTLNCSANPNTMIYNSSFVSAIRGLTYHHLTIQNSGATSPSLSGNITVNGNMTLISTTLNCNNRIITLAGNWTNTANTSCTNQNQINFTGTGVQTISRGAGNLEVFNNMNCTGTGTVRLADSLRVNGLLNITAGTLDLSASNYNLHCRGTFVDNSVFNGRQGTVFMDGTVAQVIDGVSSTTFYNLTANNAAGVSVNGTKQITNILSVQSGSFGPSAFGTVILPATGATTCARIGPLGAGASLTGTSWEIQTYIDGPATAYWQYLSTPVQSTTLADWDGDTRFYMSGVGGNDGNSCCPVFRSVRTYNEPTNTYTAVTSTGTALTPGVGYMIWMSDNMSQLGSPLVYDTRGLPTFNTVNRAVTAGGAGAGYNLVGNPYACPINYATVVSSSSATLNSSFLILQENGSYATDPNGGTIAGGQGFMCLATAGGNITFTESCKSTTANPNVVRTMAGNQIRIKAANEVNGLGEETVIRLDPSADDASFGTADLPYLASPYDNATHIWSQNENGDQFILNNLGTSADHLLIPINVMTSTPGVQLLAFKDLNTVTEYNCAWLEDLTTGARVNLNSTDTYSFEEAEMGATRNFILHLERRNDCVSDLQATEASLDAQTNVFVSSGQVFAGFGFETEEVVTVSMYDLNGKMIMGETTMNVSTQNVALTNPDSHGIYLLRIVKGNEVTTKKFYY